MSKELELKIKLSQLLGNLVYKGDTIAYFLKDELLGEIELPQGTMMESRHVLADYLGIKEYDNFIFRRADKTEVDASKVFINGLTSSGEDYTCSVGEMEGIKYQFFKNKDNCPTCGLSHYKAVYPDQKDLIDKLHKKP